MSDAFTIKAISELRDRVKDLEAFTVAVQKSNELMAAVITELHKLCEYNESRITKLEKESKNA